MSTFWRSVSSARDQLRRDVLVALDDQHPRLALDDGVGVGAVVLVEGVARGLHDDPEAQEPGLLRRELERRPGWRPPARSTGCVPASSPLTNSRTVAGCATVEVMSALTSTFSPRRAVDGEVSRSTRTSSRAARGPVRWVWTWIPRAAASAASVWPEPVVSLPSERRTIRFWASSGNSAPARRSAAPMSVAPRTGVDASRSISARSDGSRSTSASPPKATIPATSSSSFAARLSRR